MTEAEWLACDAPQTMLTFLRKRANDRKMRLFGAACWCRRGRDFAGFTQLREATFRAEQFADGEHKQQKADGKWFVFSKNAFDMAQRTSEITAGLGGRGKVPPAEQIALLRDLFGNPFRPVALEPAWLTSDVLALARGIYEEKAFDRMPILADALQDAGCDNDTVLAHCRGTAPTHVRGCWVLDLVLGKA
jgi:hypothetical protein